jgi:type I restriction enzyme S subunit
MRLYTDGLFAIPFVYPPINEQHSIVSYLDDKCSKLDKMLEGKQKQIELLAELKQRIIADAVTHGVNPDVKMRATNISWLSEIPKHWKEQRMASLFTGEIDVNKNFEFKHAFKFNYGQLVPKNEIGDPEEYRSVYVKYSKIKAGDILINGLNLNYDFVSQRVACASSDGIITSAYVVCRPRTGVNYDYYTYLFKSMDSMKLFHGMGTGIRLTLSFKELKKQMIPIPPQSEQRAIVEFIKCKEAKFDSLTSKLQQEIESIKEYKQRLISDVVTGQIKVC